MVNPDPEVRCSRMVQTGFYYPPSPSKQLRFNHQALSKVTIVTTIIIVIIQNENVNVNTITNSHNLHQTEIKYKDIYIGHLKLNFTFLVTDVNFLITTLLKLGVF